MSWIEEEQKKRKQEEQRILEEENIREREKKRSFEEDRKKKLQKKLYDKKKRDLISEFWSQLLKTNEDLPPDLKMMIEKGRLQGKVADLRQSRLTISASGDEALRIFYDPEKKALVAKETNQLYELDKDSVGILIRNLCTGRSLADDLKLDPRQIEANSKAQECREAEERRRVKEKRKAVAHRLLILLGGPIVVLTIITLVYIYWKEIIGFLGVMLLILLIYYIFFIMRW